MFAWKLYKYIGFYTYRMINVTESWLRATPFFIAAFEKYPHEILIYNPHIDSLPYLHCCIDRNFLNWHLQTFLFSYLKQKSTAISYFNFCGSFTWIVIMVGFL